MEEEKKEEVKKPQQVRFKVKIKTNYEIKELASLFGGWSW